MDGELTVILSGTSTEKVEMDGSVTKATPVVAYSEFFDTVLYGIRLENGGIAADVLSPTTPLMAWRCLKLQEHAAQQVPGNGEEELSEEAAIRFVESLFETGDTLERTFPPASDIVALWDGVPSVAIRTDFAWQLRYALGEGVLIDEDGEVRRRIDEFAREENTFPC
jgi:hypothetical protein